MSIKNKLARLKQHIIKDEDIKTSPIKDDPSVRMEEESAIQIWEEHGVQPYYFEGQYSLINERIYPIDFQHGKYKFSEIFHVTDEWNRSHLNHPLSNKGIPLSNMIFFDTETTGLGNGTGTYIFLLSYARVLEDKVIVRQHLLPNPSCEVALYHGFLTEVGDSIHLLTSYNGKAFDWPQVKSRHIFVRERVPKLPLFAHFDLYHAARRLWKHRLERMKLSIVEKEILGIKRKDDVPGYLAPMIYFDYVESKRIDGMIKVLKHNELDVLSLISLYIHLSYQLLNIGPKKTVQEVYEVGRWYASLGESSAAEETLLPIIQSDSKEGELAKYLLAMEWKKLKEWDKAIHLFEELLSAKDHKLVVNAAIELAKYYEHRKKNYRKALTYVKKISTIVTNTQKMANDLRKREERLERKLTNR